MKELALKIIEPDIYNIRRAIQLLLELSKVRITFFVAVSAAFGFILANGSISTDIIIPTLGVFILACGSSALNHYQERKTDALMDRTKSRPIPSGAVSPAVALTIVISFILLGLFLLYMTVNAAGFFLGLLAVLWYNAFYTPLKRITPMAVVPGALIGSIPPMIGWIAGGGSITDVGIYAIALFFFIWQIPHFWLLLLIYSRDYESAGFPTLTRIFEEGQLSRVTFIWIAALSVSSSLIPLSGINISFITNVLLLGSGIWLLWKSRSLLSQNYERKTFRFAFRNINTYVLLVVLLLILDKIIDL